MGSVVVFIQHDKGKVLKGSKSAITAAQQMQKVFGYSGVVAISLGSGADIAAAEVASCGVQKSLHLSSAELDSYTASRYAAVLVEIAKAQGADAVVVASTSTGKDLAPQVAALFDAGQVSEVLQVLPDKAFLRPMYAGNVLAEVVVDSPRIVATIRPTAFAPALSSGAAGEVVPINVAVPPSREKVVGYQIASGGRPELADAAIVVSGGRALGSAENFEKVLYPLADALGAAIGASRAAVDSGYAPNDWQVGQTGKVVAPQLYIALGVSGAIQHIAGMKDSKVIVAVNKDPEAPIFEVADYGLVGDLFTIAPELTKLIADGKK